MNVIGFVHSVNFEESCCWAEFEGGGAGVSPMEGVKLETLLSYLKLLRTSRS